MQLNHFVILPLLFTLFIGGSEDFNQSKYPQSSQENQAGFEQLYILGEDGQKDIVYQYQVEKQVPNQNAYKEGMDYLEQMKLPYVRNVASLLYVGYPNFAPINDVRLDLAYGLGEEDEYEYFDEQVRGEESYTHIIGGSSLAYALTQRALYDYLALFQDTTLDTKEKFDSAIEKVKQIRTAEYALLGENRVFVYRNHSGEAVLEEELTMQGAKAAENFASFYGSLLDAAIYLQVPMVNEQINKERLIVDDVYLKKAGNQYTSDLFSIDSLDGSLLRYQFKNIEAGVQIYDHLHGLIHEDTWLNSGERIEIVSDHELVNLQLEYDFTLNQRIIYYQSDDEEQKFSDLVGVGETTEHRTQSFKLSLPIKNNKGITYLIILIVVAFFVALLSIYLDRRKKKKT